MAWEPVGPRLQLLLQSACSSTCMCGHMYNWKIVIVTLNNQFTHSLLFDIISILFTFSCRVWQRCIRRRTAALYAWICSVDLWRANLVAMTSVIPVCAAWQGKGQCGRLAPCAGWPSKCVAKIMVGFLLFIMSIYWNMYFKNIIYDYYLSLMYSLTANTITTVYREFFT